MTWKTRYPKDGNFIMEIRFTVRNSESWLMQLNPLEANGTIWYNLAYGSYDTYHCIRTATWQFQMSWLDTKQPIKSYTIQNYRCVPHSY
jgi:hypothetical protein